VFKEDLKEFWRSIRRSIRRRVQEAFRQVFKEDLERCLMRLKGRSRRTWVFEMVFEEHSEGGSGGTWTAIREACEEVFDVFEKVLKAYSRRI
jgi:hypothetical protein